MSELPSRWKKIRLGDVCEHITKGATPTTYGYGWVDDGILFLRSECVTESGFSASGSERISPEAHKTMARSTIRGGDLLMTITGYIGRTCLYPKNMPEANINQHIARIRIVDEEKLDPGYTLWALKDPSLLNSLELEVTGLAYPQIGLLQVQNISLPAPPINEQHRITEILDTLNDTIQKTEQLIAKLSQIKQGLLHDLLTRGIDEHGQLRDPNAHPEQFKDSVLGSIPTAWEAVRIKDVAKIFGGKRLPAGHAYSDEPTGYTYLRVLDFFEKSVDPKTLMFLPPETFSALERYEIHDGNLYISIAGSIGYVGVFTATDNIRTILTENAARIELSEVMYPPFVAYQMNGLEVQRQIEIEKGTGGGVPKLALFRIENLRIAQPPEAEQKAIAERLLAHEKVIALEEMDLRKLMAIKKGLMDDLLVGKVRVDSMEGEDN